MSECAKCYEKKIDAGYASMQSESGRKENVYKAISLTWDEKSFGELAMFEWLQYVEFFFMRNTVKCDA